MLQKGRNVLGCVKEQRWFEKKNHIFIKRDVYYNQHLNPVEHHYLLYIIHHPVLNWEKKVSSVVNKCKSQRLFFLIWAFMWGVLCSPNHNSLNFYGIPKGQPKIPHFLSNFIFSSWKTFTYVQEADFGTMSFNILIYGLLLFHGWCD